MEPEVLENGFLPGDVEQVKPVVLANAYVGNSQEEEEEDTYNSKGYVYLDDGIPDWVWEDYLSREDYSRAEKEEFWSRRRTPVRRFPDPDDIIFTAAEWL